jgi:hypothetical protein
MTSITTEILESIEIGKPLHHENLTIHPITYAGSAGPKYESLDEAIKKGHLIITEVSESGSVPNLALRNKSRTSVLILDGEELHGAKQNRVMNTTIMVAVGMEMDVPVSCTEQGRWSYNSPRFASSENVMRHDVRSRKMSSVHLSLSKGRGYASDQNEVWEAIRTMQAESGVSSPTGAMSDTFDRHRKKMDEFVKAFPVMRNQAGLLAFIDGRLAGCDIISRPKAYQKVHAKLLRSYAVDAVVEKPRPHRQSSEEIEGDRVADFLAAVAQCQGEMFPSVGLGNDVRFKGPDLIGSALLVEGSPVHSAFFPKPAERERRGDPDLIRSRFRAGNLWDKMTG